MPTSRIIVQGLPIIRSDESSLAHEFINVDEDINIDADHSEGVIRVKHTKNNNVDVIRVTDKASSSVQFKVDSRGDIEGRNVTGNDLIATNTVITPVISLAGVNLATDLADVKADIVTAQAAADDAQTGVDANTVILAAATHIHGGLPDTLVKRSAVNGTEIDNLVVTGRETDYNPAGNANGLYAEGDYPPPGLVVVDQYATGQINMLQHCNLSFSPYDNANPAAEILTKNFYFGRAPPEVGETVQTADSDRDGLFIEDAQTGQTTLITCVDTEPNIKIEANKTKSNGKPIIPALAVFD